MGTCGITTSSGVVGGKKTKEIRKSVLSESYEYLYTLKRKDYEKLWKTPFVELFKQLDACAGPDDAYDWDKARPIKTMIATKLGLVLISGANDDLHEILNELLDTHLKDTKQLLKSIKELENKFENHRHKKTPNYSEKPVW